MPLFNSLKARVGGLLVLVVGLYAGAVVAQQVDASGQVNITPPVPLPSRATNPFGAAGIIKVRSTAGSAFPMIITAFDLINGTMLANAAGRTNDGKPYVNVARLPVGLGSGDPTSKVLLKCNTPQRATFSSAPMAYRVVMPVLGWTPAQFDYTVDNGHGASNPMLVTLQNADAPDNVSPAIDPQLRFFVAVGPGTIMLGAEAQTPRCDRS